MYVCMSVYVKPEISSRVLIALICYSEVRTFLRSGHARSQGARIRDKRGLSVSVFPLSKSRN